MTYANCLRALGLATVLALSSCTGQIGAGQSPGEGPTGTEPAVGPTGLGVSPANSGGGQTPGPTVPPPGVSTAACGSAVDPGYVGLRRLTRVEYNNTMRDLLGDTTQPASAFPNDDSVLATGSQVSALYFEKHESAAERLISEAWQRELAGKQPATARLMVCPLKPGDTACARMIVTSFARRAWRRPVTAAELEPYLALIAIPEKNGEDTTAGVRLALQGVLEAPEFMFRVETDTAAGPRNLTAHELAVRLSYMLWSTMPDQRLFELADNGTLTQPSVLAGELSRLLGDAKAAAFASGFVGHWLSLGSLASSQPDATLSGGFDEPLRQAMGAETVALFRAFLDGGSRFSDIMQADFTFVKDRLARHYGVALPSSAAPPAEVRRVSLPAGPRRGLLTHGGLLTMTSGPTNTSPVKRGKFVSTYLLCTKPPPPPPGADTLPKEAGAAKTERERLAIHRANPQCAACHALMDPIGLGMENFDLVGRYRKAYADGTAIDPSGELQGAGKFATFEELRTLLASDARVPGCVAQHLFVYAIGRELTSGDQCVNDAIMQKFGASERFTDLLAALAGSPPFAQRRAEITGGAP